MIKNLKKKLIAGLLALSVFATAIPATDVYASSGYNGLNGTEVVQLSHVHDYNEEHDLCMAFSFLTYSYHYELCVNPIRYTDGHSEDCNEVRYYKYNKYTEKKTYISEETFKKAYNTWRKSNLTNGGIVNWLPGKYKPKQLRIDKKNYLRVRIPSFDMYCEDTDNIYLRHPNICYEVRISTNKNMKNSKVFTGYKNGSVYEESYTVKGKKYFELVIRNYNKKYIKKGKTYYVQVRPVGRYKVVKGGKYYDVIDNLLKDGKYEKVVQKTRKLCGTWSDKVKLKVGTANISH